jgi:lycopene cyclase
MFVQQRQNKFDCIIVGGGLAGGLLLAALRYEQPNLKTLLVEKNATLGGEHTWSFHGTDVPHELPWLTPLISKSWPSHEVFFPEHHRVLKSSYHSIRADEFHQMLVLKHQDHILLNTAVTKLTTSSVTLASGEKILAEYVIDARGWPAISKQKSYGYQKFLGLDVELESPHGLTHAILKDARVPQTDGYRFFYVLPWDEKRLLVEDTYYSNTSDVQSELWRNEILKYIAARGWKIKNIERQEIGCLPLDLEEPAAYDGETLTIGAASGIYQPVTGYTFPQTLERVLTLSKLSPYFWREALQDLRAESETQSRYLRILNRMMFLAAEPAKRYKILERFYHLPESLIARFYQGKLTFKDQIRILVGKPPVSIIKAVKALW